MAAVTNTFARVLAGVVTAGTSEFAPNNPITGRNKKYSLGWSAGKVLTLGTGDTRKGNKTVVSGTVLDPNESKEQPIAQETPAADTQKATEEVVAEGSRRRKLARGFRSTILSQLVPRGAAAARETIGT